MKISFNMKDIWPEEGDFISFCENCIIDLTNLTTLEYPTNMNLFIFKPIWRRYCNSNAKFKNDFDGQKSFIDNMTNQIQEIALDFFIWSKANVEFFTDFINEDYKNKALTKAISSSIEPINDYINQTLYETNIAKGTTSQNVNEVVKVGSAWNSSVQSFMTPSRKNDMLNSFRWLFVTYVPIIKDDVVTGVIDDLGTYSTNGYDFMEVDPTNITPENIKEGVNILGVIGELDATTLVETSRTYTSNGVYEINANAGESFKKISVNVNIPSDVILYSPTYVDGTNLTQTPQTILETIKQQLSVLNVTPYALVATTTETGIVLNYEPVVMDDIQIIVDSTLYLYHQSIFNLLTQTMLGRIVLAYYIPTFGVRIPDTAQPTTVFDNVYTLSSYTNSNRLLKMAVRGGAIITNNFDSTPITIHFMPQFTIKMGVD